MTGRQRERKTDRCERQTDGGTDMENKRQTDIERLEDVKRMERQMHGLTERKIDRRQTNGKGGRDGLAEINL